MSAMIEEGNLKKTKSSTHFLDRPIFFDLRMADLASATLPKTPPALTVPKGELCIKKVVPVDYKVPLLRGGYGTASKGSVDVKGSSFQ